MSIFAPAKRINYISTNLKIMYLDAAKKQEIFEKYGKSNTDTGSAEAQIALDEPFVSHLYSIVFGL